MFTRHLQPSFAGGEVSPALAARVDSAAYPTWLKKAHNFFIHPQGGASNRPGTAHMGMAKTSGQPCRLLPFVVGEEEAYVLEFGPQYIRAYTSSGQVLSPDGSVYELASPYSAQALSGLSYTQFDQTLFLAHPAYPPQCLKRVSRGQFVLEEYPVRFGPFMLANTNPQHQLRIFASQQTHQSAGAAASLSFSPVVDSRYFVYGYFNGELFFVPRSYGLDVAFLVSEFNRQFSSRGLEAANLGGVVRITSSSENGGDWNGAVLRLTYQDSFVHDPSFVLEQVLSGGANAGQTVVSGEVSYLLESNADLFSPDQVGGRFSLTHAVESQYQTGTLAYQDVSAVLKTASDWRVHTTGNWSGTLAVEKSEDLGATWSVVKHLVRAEGADNPLDMGLLEDNGQVYCWRLRACGITGQAGYELSSASFVQQGIAVITGYISPRQVTVSLERPCASEAWTSDWAEGSFSPKNGYPSCVFLYQDRLGLAGTYAEPQTLWFSKTGNYGHFGHARGSLLDNDSISINLSGKKLNAIHSVVAAGKLLVFTAGSEWSLSCSGALTPYNVQIEQQSERGCSRVPAVMVGNRALYVQARGSALRDLYYEDAVAAYTGEDLTLCAKHLFEQKSIREVAYQQEPDNLVWCVLSDGTLAVLTYVAEQNICAWTHHDTQGFFRSVCVIPNRGYDEVWFAVERNGQYRVEKLLARLASKLPQDQNFLDASVSKKSTEAFEEMEGLAHLEGCEVAALVDGSPVYGLTVQSGKITLPCAASCVHAGLPYRAQIQTLPLGVATDSKKRVVAVTVQLADSRGGQLALEGETADDIIQRTTEPYNTPLELKTESYQMSLSGHHTLTPSVIFTQTDPLPVTLLAVSSRIA